MRYYSQREIADKIHEVTDDLRDIPIGDRIALGDQLQAIVDRLDDLYTIIRENDNIKEDSKWI